MACITLQARLLGKSSVRFCCRHQSIICLVQSVWGFTGCEFEYLLLPLKRGREDLNSWPEYLAGPSQSLWWCAQIVAGLQINRQEPWRVCSFLPLWEEIQELKNRGTASLYPLPGMETKLLCWKSYLYTYHQDL